MASRQPHLRCATKQGRQVILIISQPIEFNSPEKGPFLQVGSVTLNRRHPAICTIYHHVHINPTAHLSHSFSFPRASERASEGRRARAQFIITPTDRPTDPTGSLDPDPPSHRQTRRRLPSHQAAEHVFPPSARPFVRSLSLPFPRRRRRRNDRRTDGRASGFKKVCS